MNLAAMEHLLRLWRDERGDASAASFMLLVTILALGAIVGLTTFRDQVVQELGDLATAIDSLDQSFSAGVLGSYADPGPMFADPAGDEPACLSVTEPASEESP
jgi:Flp pilus assembly pilin Flp